MVQTTFLKGLHMLHRNKMFITPCNTDLKKPISFNRSQRKTTISGLKTEMSKNFKTRSLKSSGDQLI